MSRLRLRLDVPNLAEGPLQYGVVANIYQVSGGRLEEHRPAADRERLRNLLIPTGHGWEPGPQFLEVDLEPGRYVVEAILPSAEVVSEEVTVEESAQPQELRLSGARSPREWLGWHHFSGNVEQEVAYKRQVSTAETRGSVLVRTELVSVVTPPPDGEGPAQVSTPGALVSRGFFFALPTSRDIDPTRPLSDFFPFDEPDPPAHVTSLKPDPFERDAVSENYLIGRSPPESPRAGHDWPGDYRAPRFERRYLFVRGAGLPPQVAALPVPWMQADHSGLALVEALVRRTVADPGVSAGVDRGYRVSITVRDGLVGSVIGYLGAGKLPAAATVITRARDMLFMKVANPLAAAAGAYVLLGAGEPGQPGEHVYWHDWVRNLMNWFKWLPDGAIQHAWVKLSQQRNEQNLREARDSLLEGYRRGLPYYSKGVGMLMDGLSLFANDARAEGRADEEIEDALRTVRQLALRTNMRQPFTTVLLRERRS